MFKLVFKKDVKCIGVGGRATYRILACEKVNGSKQGVERCGDDKFALIISKAGRAGQFFNPAKALAHN